MLPETGASQAGLPEYVNIGIITRPHGVKGAVRIAPMTDDPQRFKLLSRVYIQLDDQRNIYTPKQIQFANNFVIIQFTEVNSREDAEKLRNCYIEIPREECMPLPDGQHYYFELIGLTVQTEQNEPVGQLVDILSYPANDVYVIRNNSKEILIPAVKEFVTNVDLKAGVMTINPIDGLLD